MAEDDASVRRYLEVVLRRAGYEVTACEDGAAAMQAALTDNFDIAVFDAIMPHLTGYELCRIFRQHPTLKEIPLIVLSGLEAEANTEADVYLLKTANLQEELLHVVALLLNSKTQVPTD